jgi:hypothetical protein
MGHPVAGGRASLEGGVYLQSLIDVGINSAVALIED